MGVAAPPGVPLSTGARKALLSAAGDRGPHRAECPCALFRSRPPPLGGRREPPDPRKPIQPLAEGSPQTDSDLFVCVTGSQRKSHAVSLWRDRGGATPAPSAGGPTPDREERRSLRNGRSAPACAAAPPLRASRIASAAEARLRGERGRCKVGARPLGVKWWPAALQGPGLRWSLADTPDDCCINFHPGPRRLSHQASLGLGDPGDPHPTTPSSRCPPGQTA